MSSKEDKFNAAASIGGSLVGGAIVTSKGPGKDVDKAMLKALRKAKKEKKKAAKKAAETKAKNNKSSSMAIIVAAKSSTAAVAPKPSEKKAPPIAVVPHEFGIHGNNYKGAKDKKNGGGKDGRGSTHARKTVSNRNLETMKAGTNHVVNASAKRQELAGGDKKTLLDKLFTAVENDRNDALHGLLLRRKNARKKYRWSINNNGGGPQNLLPGEPWSLLSTRLRFPNISHLKYWCTSDSKKKHLGPQVYKWSSENKTKGLSLKSYTNSRVWMEATLHFEPV